MEESMLDIMYELPSKNDVAECIITDETVLSKAPPVYRNKKERAA